VVGKHIVFLLSECIIMNFIRRAILIVFVMLVYVSLNESDGKAISSIRTSIQQRKPAGDNAWFENKVKRTQKISARILKQIEVNICQYLIIKILIYNIII